VKGVLIGLGLLVVAAVAAVIWIVSGHYTECFADFPSTKQAELVLTEAHAMGLDDADLIARPRSASIRISSGETGADAQDFRRTVHRLVHAGGGHLEKNTPCLERPFFD
jgi:hypothetical protein